MLWALTSGTPPAARATRTKTTTSAFRHTSSIIRRIIVVQRLSRIIFLSSGYRVRHPTASPGTVPNRAHYKNINWSTARGKLQLGSGTWQNTLTVAGLLLPILGILV